MPREKLNRISLQSRHVHGKAKSSQLVSFYVFFFYVFRLLNITSTNSHCKPPLKKSREESLGVECMDVWNIHVCNGMFAIPRQIPPFVICALWMFCIHGVSSQLVSVSSAAGCRLSYRAPLSASPLTRQL